MTNDISELAGSAVSPSAPTKGYLNHCHRSSGKSINYRRHSRRWRPGNSGHFRRVSGCPNYSGYQSLAQP